MAQQLRSGRPPRAPCADRCQARLIGGLLLLLLSAQPSVGQPTTDPDNVGFFFDVAATVSNYHTTEDWEVVTAYLILLNASDHSGIAGFDAFIEYTPLTPAPPESDCFTGYAPYPYLVLTCTPPLPWSPTILLGTWHISVPSPAMSILFYIRPGYDDPSYIPAGSGFYDRVTVCAVSGDYDLPVATINADPPIAREERTWGTLKALYRDD